MNDDEFLTPQEAARLLKVSLRTVRRYIEESRLPYLQLGPSKAIRIPRDALSVLLRGRWSDSDRVCRLCPYRSGEKMQQLELVMRYFGLKERKDG